MADNKNCPCGVTFGGAGANSKDVCPRCKRMFQVWSGGSSEWIDDAAVKKAQQLYDSGLSHFAQIHKEMRNLRIQLKDLRKKMEKAAHPPMFMQAPGGLSLLPGPLVDHGDSYLSIMESAQRRIFDSVLEKVCEDKRPAWHRATLLAPEVALAMRKEQTFGRRLPYSLFKEAGE